MSTFIPAPMITDQPVGSTFVENEVARGNGPPLPYCYQPSWSSSVHDLWCETTPRLVHLLLHYLAWAGATIALVATAYLTVRLCQHAERTILSGLCAEPGNGHPAGAGGSGWQREARVRGE